MNIPVEKLSGKWMLGMVKGLPNMKQMRRNLWKLRDLTYSLQCQSLHLPLYQLGGRENTAKRNLSATQRKKKSGVPAQGYHLAYFNLWWSRMAREGKKEIKETKERDMMEVVARRKERSKRMFNNKSTLTCGGAGWPEKAERR